ncbi:MAG TPA: hypothetical protein PK941_12085, partial [Paludibacter sp.]|nr:hypothetical protein [Paludibacter sp.]
LDFFLLRFFVSRQKNEVGFGQSPRFNKIIMIIKRSCKVLNFSHLQIKDFFLHLMPKSAEFVVFLQRFLSKSTEKSSKRLTVKVQRELKDIFKAL